MADEVVECVVVDGEVGIDAPGANGPALDVGCDAVELVDIGVGTEVVLVAGIVEDVEGLGK